MSETRRPPAETAGTEQAGARVLAVIPARGGSKGVPGKNLAPVGGVPLVARAVRACVRARRVGAVVVSTDDPSIAEAARTAGAEVVLRPVAIAGDTATSEAAVLHAMDAHEAMAGGSTDVVLLVQCTSPFITSDEIDGVVAAVLDDGADTAHTVAPFHGFIWREGAESTEGAEGAAGGSAHGVNHDKATRPRRQDRPQDLLETGTAYAMRAPGFRAAGHRFFGRTALVRTDPAKVLEIDEPADLQRARALAPLLDPTAATPTRDDVDAVVLDFDGTQTDDRVLIDSDGHEAVTVHRGDGLGIAALRRAGLPVLILSTETNPVVAARARKLDVPVLHGIDRKDLALKQWCEENGIAPERVLYAGNDVNDLPCFGLVGWPVAVAQAHDVVRAAARAITTAEGGHGAIREIAAWLLGPTLAR
ncbi:acylneuraminate cytidylyltransferase [Streptomyces cocklensis]|jgi:YrbI family 3-deoxy-D-manno-octulosonate 8-phosphate phosphatase|uniref:N-acylneuraminate cytidylyltransferase n=1 Tax=Actinacidiphila cocklensis TaxID=887465 RepID=A0A9W4DT75_9ACTN|nr:acylneuraminate cytidylyltransferase [Actinacidiphila cocklensis]MDD1063129.1 acylneuraminate cytidylyltransferase [Actinacidiphila cocklensis]WSX77195.1 acylneuraminate cytidylyltransferase [Streptomyces sp. NBC_00899]CAG6395569.1 N-Acetylneuraminate cytidylyltransferase [Actinacidiphila cocklensis]